MKYPIRDAGRWCFVLRRVTYRRHGNDFWSKKYILLEGRTLASYSAEVCIELDFLLT